ncbi:MAG: hypothetical protein M3094_06005 [Actinomycetia bacterium]|nr:hypothetical protein [Actinomycetes bacterium]
MKTIQRICIGAAVAFIAAACSSSSDSGTPDTTVTTVTIATTEVPSTTTTTPPETTTTTEPSITDDAEVLLDMVNAAMGDETSFLSTGTASFVDATDTDTEYVSAVMIGGQSSQDNSWIMTTLTIETGDLAGTVQFEVRRIDGTKYTQNPFTGDWKAKAESDPNPVTDILNGELVLADPTAVETPGGYTISGSFPPDPSNDLIEITVDSRTLTVSTLTTYQTDPRADMTGLVPPGEGDITTITTWDFGDYGIELASPLTPPENTATAVTRFNDGAFTIQIPTSWNEATPEEISNAGLEVDRAWGSEDGIIVMVVTDDLIELNIGATSLEEYVTLISNEVLADTDIQDTVLTNNLQGVPIAMVLGTIGDSGERRYVRLLSVQDDIIATNITIIGPADAIEENIEAVMFLLNSLLFDT